MKKTTLFLSIGGAGFAIICSFSSSLAGVSRGGERNTNEGNMALHSNTSGSDNTALGDSALYSNTEGSTNTAVGSQALYSNSTSSDGGNTAVGYQALFSNTSGIFNMAFGHQTLLSCTTGIRNCAIGSTALQNFVDGDSNTSLGNASMLNTLNASYNTAVGRRALFRVNASNDNIALGFYAASNLRTGDNNIDIGNLGVNTESNNIRIGTVTPAVTIPVNTLRAAHTDTYIAGIFGSMTSGGTPVFVDANGKLGTMPSSARFKDEIKPIDEASETIFRLRPVTFRYKPQITKDSRPQFGLVAEEVAKVNPDLVVRDDHGEIYSVRYEAVNALLLNEFIKQHRQVEEQQRQIDKLTA